MRALLATLLIPSLAFAGWRSVAPQGATINDVQMVDAGLVLVSSEGATGNASLLGIESDGGVTIHLSRAGASKGAAVFGACLVAVDTGGNLFFGASCGTTDFTAFTSSAVRLRGFGSSGFAVTSVSANVLTLKIGSLGTTAVTTYGTAAWSANSGDAIPRVLRSGAQDLIVINTTANSFRLSVDGGAPLNTVYPNGPFTDFSLVERTSDAGSALPSAIGVKPTGVVIFPDIRANAGAVVIPVDGGLARIAVSDVTMGATPDGGLVSPIPDPANEFVNWRRRNQTATFTRLSCLETRWCAAGDTAGNLWVYENANSPTVQGPSNAAADAGATIRLTLDAGDLDDDPLFHSWSVGGGAVVIDVPGSEDGLSKDISLPAVMCGALPITVTSTDGLYMTTTMFNVNVGARGALEVTTPAMAPVAGGGPVTYSAGVDGGCDTATFTWSTQGGQMGSGPTFAYQPPATSCATSDNITVTATWQSGLPATSSTQVLVNPTPWGAPFAPIFTQPATQLTGTTQTWSPLNAEHVCVGSGGYPGTSLIWDFIDAGATTVTVVDGGLQIDAQSNCIASQVFAVAHREVVGETLGRRSDGGTLVVDVVPDIPPLDATAMFGVTAFADSGVAFGNTTLTASCLTQRDLAAKIFVYEGATQVAATSGATPGPWSIPVPGGCAGGAREVVAQLYEDGGFTGAEARAMITFESTPAAVGPMTPTLLTARCGEGVRGRLSLQDVPGTCSAVERSWRQTDGSALVTSSGLDAIDVQTAALDLSMAGQQLTFEWSVDAGSGNGATATRTVDIGVDPFVAVKTRSKPLIRREESSFELEITLTNTTGCAVEGLDVEIPLNAADPIASTLNVDSVNIASVVEGNVLRASGISLPASGKVVLTLAAKPRLLGTPTTVPTVTLRGLPVSIVEPAAIPATGCGCSTEPGIAAVLLAFFALGRRRRRE